MPYASATQTLDYDTLGRVTTLTNTKGGQTDYFLDLPNGRLLERYRRVAGMLRVEDGTDISGHTVWRAMAAWHYFGGRRVSLTGAPVASDRLGSVGDGSAHHPYGEDRTAAANDQFQFATYWRDGGTGLDYAQQRHYASTYGRFTSIDPADGSASPANPGTWNRYQYADFDPINKIDPQGTWAWNAASLEQFDFFMSGGDWGTAAVVARVAMSLDSRQGRSVGCRWRSGSWLCSLIPPRPTQGARHICGS